MQALRCSSLERYSACSGAYLAGVAAETAGLAHRDQNDGAAEGTRLHAEIAALLEKAIAVKADPRAVIADTVATEEMDYAVRYCVTAAMREVPPEWARLTCLVEVPHASGMLEGTPDFAVVGSAEGWVFDWKTGWGGNYAPASRNWQMRGYVYLLAQRYPAVVEWHAMMAVPSHVEESRRTSLTTFRLANGTLEGCKAAVERLCEFVANNKGLFRTPTMAACKWCPAAGTAACKESTALVCTMAELEATLSDVSAKAMPIAQLADLTRQAVMAERAAGVVKSEMKRRLLEGETTPDESGFTLKPGAWRRQITDNGACATAVAALATLDELLVVSEIKVAQLRSLITRKMKALGMSGFQAEQEFMVLVAPFLEEKQNAPSLVECK